MEVRERPVDGRGFKKEFAHSHVITYELPAHDCEYLKTERAYLDKTGQSDREYMVFENQRETWKGAEALCKSNLKQAVANDTFGELRDMLSKNREK